MTTTDTYESTITRYYDLLNAAKLALAVLAEHEQYDDETGSREHDAAEALRVEIERESA
jgi:hypothetical protein